ncbi:MAG TPA: heme ABC exporter ATP-binding protein CcmA [Opitutaceae bacterium]|nr:heme ABC exporter ATP-binding protein CcmA [Opitutaceae bacterium]
MILVRNLTKSFGARRVLDGLDLEVEPGAVTLLVGANGAGKTTSLRLIAGLSSPDAGTIAIAGHDLFADRSSALAQMAFLPQSPRFHPRLTVRETTEFYAHLRGRRSEVDCALDVWGLAEHSRVPTGKLSGGLRQRLALAIITLASAPVILLDEPSLSLDPEWRHHLQEFLSAEAARGCTVLVATHLLGEWEGRTDRCILVERGKARGDLPPDRISEWFPVALRGSAGTESHPHAALSRSSRSGLHSEPVALRVSAGTIDSSRLEESRSSRSGLQCEPCA